MELYCSDADPTNLLASELPACQLDCSNPQDSISKKYHLLHNSTYIMILHVASQAPQF